VGQRMRESVYRSCHSASKCSKSGLSKGHSFAHSYSNHVTQNKLKLASLPFGNESPNGSRLDGYL
jgi:hypothetical protein